MLWPRANSCMMAVSKVSGWVTAERGTEAGKPLDTQEGRRGWGKGLVGKVGGVIQTASVEFPSLATQVASPISNCFRKLPRPRLHLL